MTNKYDVNVDKMVKMWSPTGQLLGVLKQNVHVGMKSPMWHFQVDVLPWIDREDEAVCQTMQDIAEIQDSKSSTNFSPIDSISQLNSAMYVSIIIMS
jgi:hypothetical protein